MLLRRFLTITLFFALTLPPAATAGWGMRGSYEPDTAEDATGAYMPLDPDQDANPNVRKVYLNGFVGNGAAWPLSLNPNSAALQTANLQFPFRAYALLGVWKDCNLDGYLGFGDNVLFQYSAVLLPAANACPASSAEGAHNDGTTVREFFPLGPDGEEDTNRWNIADEAAIVWADFKRPGDSPDPTCPVTPLPSGTLHSTGGMLRYVDCMDNWLVTSQWNDVAHIAGQDELAFDDAPYYAPDESASPLNQPSPYGEYSAPPLVQAYDCSEEPALQVSDPTGALPRSIEDPTGIFGTITLTDADGNYLVARAPTVPTVNNGGSVASTVAYNGEAVFEDCDPSSGWAPGNSPYAVEGDRPATVREGRRMIDLPMAFREGGDDGDVFTDSVAGLYRLDNDYGLAPPTRNDWFWVGIEGFLVSRNPFVDKDSLQPRGVSYVTFYAHVSASALELPPSSGTYGSEWCSRSTDPALNGGLVCDAAQWTSAIRVGQPYELRDIDCYDTSVAGAREAGVGWGLASGTECA